MTSFRTQKRETRHSQRWRLSLTLLSLTVLVAAPAFGQGNGNQDQVVTIEGTRIQGEQELPTVLYLVPWQPVASKGPAPMERRLMTGQAPALQEREDFRRRLRYHQTQPELTSDQRSQDTQE
ncbi:hypothetical protein GCM10007071_36530 [Marinobacter zhanjiangensis]|uniref:Uncharacterized protein n=2 Tax=Marinobacter zhanjiangensis TaxID=578215 RepID=A0ABQ3B9W1_9GAMM|nr:hypothetical protein GCM10007071_36530 [Marinobacter zhanjiangensis]